MTSKVIVSRDVVFSECAKLCWKNDAGERANAPIPVSKMKLRRLQHHQPITVLLS